jgi:tetratricopeptide (TPR) repeat protein
MKYNKKFIYGAAFLTGLICFAVYFKALSCGFVNYDDQDYVINNTGIRTLDWEFWKWAFTTVPINFWVPLIWVSYALDYHFWGLNPLGYHLTNIILHAANTGLVVIIAHEFYKSGKFTDVGKLPEHRFLYIGMLMLAGLLFGIHPARVESVVWVTERKDVLNGVFTLSSILFYVRYQHAKEESQNTRNSYSLYVLSLFLFICSLLAKPSSLILPVSLLVIDMYPLCRFHTEKIQTILIEKIPYFTVSVALTMVSALWKYNFNSFDELPFSIRLIAAGNSLFQYFKIMIFPVNILPYYDLPRLIPQKYIVYALFMAFVAGLSIVFFRKVPRLSTIVIFFIITILPSLHFFAGGMQIILGPRYSYLPSLLPSIIVAEMIASIINRLSDYQHRYAKFVIVGMVTSQLIFYAATTQQDIGSWKNSGTLWSKVIDYQPFYRAYFNRALYYFDSGNYPKAVDDYSTCISLVVKESGHDIYNLYAFRGESLIKAGRFGEAIKDFDFAIAAFPHQLYYYHRGMAFERLGKFKEANEDFMRAGRAKGQMCWFSVGSPTQ